MIWMPQHCSIGCSVTRREDHDLAILTAPNRRPLARPPILEIQWDQFDGSHHRLMHNHPPASLCAVGQAMNVTSAYVLGHADLEIERLQFQADIIAGVSRRLIRECGIGPGMRVLDIGCGAGDVSMLLAEAVGDTGSVVAFDRESRAIEMARTKAIAAGHRQIEFVVASDEAFPACGVFDAAIGRYILHHQSDPVAMIRRAATAVRQGVSSRSTSPQVTSAPIRCRSSVSMHL